MTVVAVTVTTTSTRQAGYESPVATSTGPVTHGDCNILSGLDVTVTVLPANVAVTVLPVQPECRGKPKFDHRKCLNRLSHGPRHGDGARGGLPVSGVVRSH